MYSERKARLRISLEVARCQMLVTAVMTNYLLMADLDVPLDVKDATLSAATENFVTACHDLVSALLATLPQGATLPSSSKLQVRQLGKVRVLVQARAEFSCVFSPHRNWMDELDGFTRRREEAQIEYRQPEFKDWLVFLTLIPAEAGIQTSEVRP